jgi:hypothetical protein
MVGAVESGKRPRFVKKITLYYFNNCILIVRIMQFFSKLSFFKNFLVIIKIH